MRNGNCSSGCSLHAFDNVRSGCGYDTIPVSCKLKPDGRAAEMDKSNIYVDQIVVTQGNVEVALDMHAWKGVFRMQCVADT